ncbi:head decoration protein [Ancylobacter sp. WKF20]|uniref:head decoration protein n=1 Tax=Ancylobacter sp. WKF20 TaxID=3039801 RepID=UPI002434481E|nr:head decoration protein [Ancylobacter sp. WKF20]WGD31215.1 head decoration protein [Ancylobacter sp. WKF20]
MTVLTEPRRDGEFILNEVNGGGNFSRDTIVIASGAGKVQPGTALGKVTASGKYVPSPATGSDGSQTAVALNVAYVDATSADVKVAAITRSTEVNGKILAYDSTVNDDTKKAAKATQLAAVGIIVR